MTFAMALPRQASSVPLVLSLGGLTANVQPREKSIVAAMRECIEKFTDGSRHAAD